MGSVSHTQNCGVSEARGGRGGRRGGWQKRPLDSEARGRKKEDVLRTASVGDGAPRQMTSQAQDPKFHIAQQRMSSPTGSRHQHRALCPSPLIPAAPPGWLEAGRTQEKGMSLLSTSAFTGCCKAAQSLPAWPGPSLRWVPARPGCCRAPGLGRGTQTEGLSYCSSHRGTGEGWGRRESGQGRGEASKHLKIRQRGHQLVQLPGGRGGRDARLLLARGGALRAAHLPLIHSDGGAAGRARHQRGPRSPAPCSPRAASPPQGISPSAPTPSCRPQTRGSPPAPSPSWGAVVGRGPSSAESELRGELMWEKRRAVRMAPFPARCRWPSSPSSSLPVKQA